MGFLGWGYFQYFMREYGFVLLIPGYLAAAYASRGTALIPVVGLMLVAEFLLRRDAEAENSGNEIFRNHGLFLRYSYNFFRLELPFEFESPQRAEDGAGKIIGLLRERLAEKLGAAATANEFVWPRNLDTSETRPFLRLISDTPAGSRNALYVYPSVFGRFVVFHFHGQSRGVIRLIDHARFLCKAPFDLWYWIVPVLLRDWSLMQKVSRGTRDSFDWIDLIGNREVLQMAFVDELKSVLRDQGVLTPEIEQKIDTVVNYYITNSVFVPGSGNVIGNITQATNQRSGRAPGGTR